MVIKSVHLNLVSFLLQEDDIDPAPSKKEKQGLSLFTLPFCDPVPVYLKKGMYST